MLMSRGNGGSQALVQILQFSTIIRFHVTRSNHYPHNPIKNPKDDSVYFTWCRQNVENFSQTGFITCTKRLKNDDVSGVPFGRRWLNLIIRYYFIGHLDSNVRYTLSIYSITH